MEVPTQLHYCRWDWCDETFTSAQQHREHIEEHIKRVIPIRRSDVKLVQRAEGKSTAAVHIAVRSPQKYIFEFQNISFKMQ